MATGDEGVRRQSGSVMFTALLLMIIMAGLVQSVLIASVGASKATSQHVIESKLLFAAESGLNYGLVKMQSDRLFAVHDIGGYTADMSASRYVGSQQPVMIDDGKTADFQLSVQYLSGSTPVMFGSRSDPTEVWDSIVVVCRVTAGTAVREIMGRYRMEFHGGAILSVAQPTGDADDGKSGAQAGNIVFDGAGRSEQQHYIYGGILANGDAFYEDADGLPDASLTNENINDYLAGFRGSVSANLDGTWGEIPDFTAIGGGAQLFDFDRFHAAATAGAGRVFGNLDDFAAAVSAGEHLEGIIVVEVDSAEESSPKIKESELGRPIEVTGTLMFKFSDGTDPFYKVVVEVDVNVNAADLSDLDPADETTFTTAYPPVYVDPGSDPRNVTISPDFPDFVADSDLPALMFNTGVVDFHRGTNICGAVYGPSFIEIENKVGRVQYFNGIIIGGGGVYYEGHGSEGFTAVRYDESTVRDLATSGGVGKSLTRVGYAITK